MEVLRLLGYKRGNQSVILLIDIVVLSVSFLIAVFTRFFLLIEHLGSALIPEIYTTGFLALALIYIVVFSVRKDNRNIYKKSSIENISVVIQNQIFLLVFFLCFLFLVHRSERISRTVIGIFFILNTVFDSLVRLVYSHYLLKLIESNHKNIEVVLISSLKNAPYFIKQNGAEICGGNSELGQIDIKGCYCIDNTSIDRIKRIVRKTNSRWLIDSLIDTDIYRDLIEYMTINQISYYTTVDILGEAIPYETSRFLNKSLLIEKSFLKKKSNILGITYTVSDIGEAVSYIKSSINNLRGEYVCFSNAHTSVMSVDDKDYRMIQNSSAYTFADGYSVVKQQQRQGFAEAKRVAGPDFMDEMFNATMDGSLKHYFYGSTEETICKLKERVEKEYPGTVVAGMYAPPFGKRTPEEDAEDIKRINSSGADLIWVALGAPKQEKWMAAHKDKVNGLMLGVGAAFDFHAGTIKRAPEFVQKIGFEWLYRLFQDPKRLIKRYLITNIKFIWYVWRNK